MSLSTNDFNEDATSDADFNPQKSVLPNSDIESADVNIIAERALRRTRRLLDIKLDKAGGTITGNLTLANGTNFSVGANTTFNNAVSFQDTVGLSAPLSVSGAGKITIESSGELSLVGPTTRSGPLAIIGDDATTARRGEYVNQAVATATLDDTEDFYYTENLANSANVYTLQSTPTPAAYSEMEVAIYGLLNGHTVDFVREDATSLVGITGSGSNCQAVIRFRFVTQAGEWRVMSVMLSTGMTATYGTWA